MGFIPFDYNDETVMTSFRSTSQPHTFFSGSAFDSEISHAYERVAYILPQ